METTPQDQVFKTSALIVSEDAEFITALINAGKDEYDFWTRDSIQFIFDTPGLLDSNGIVIFDVETNDNDIDTAVNQILSIKRQDPTQVLMLVGEAEFLGKVLKSRIQPLIYRAFSKPLSANQIYLGFKSAMSVHFDLVTKQAAGINISEVGPSENRTDVDSLVNERNSKSAIYAVMGVAVLAILGWWLLADNYDNDAIDDNRVVDVATPVNETTVLEPSSEQLTKADTEVPINDDLSGSIQQINELNQLAATAMLEDRVISPKGDNALYYYDQVLTLDAYDSTAYQGRKDIAKSQRELYDVMVEKAAFDQALSIINVLQRIEPLNLQNDDLRKRLQVSIDAHVKQIQSSGTSEEISQTTTVLEKMGGEFAGSKSASNALQAEKRLVAKIDMALEKNNLTPPKKNNAYTIVSLALKDNTVSQANLQPRVKSLSSKLLTLANTQYVGDNIKEAKKLTALVKRLNVDRAGLSKLEKQITAKQAALKSAIASADKDKQEEEQIAAVEEVKIIPAKIISRASPRYPNRAIQRNVEGWVEVSFQIDTKGVPINIAVLAAEPENVFNNAALKAVQKWQFSPARIEESGLPVESNTIRTKVNFKLN